MCGLSPASARRTSTSADEEPRVNGIGLRQRLLTSPRQRAPGHRSATPSSHPTGPVANESARPAHATTPAAASPSSASTTDAMVFGSCRSRRVAVSATAGGGAPPWTALRCPTATAPAGADLRGEFGSDDAVVSARPLPMSCTARPATAGRGGIRVVNALARETVSTRWSTVQMCTTSRGGRSRTAPHSGNSLPHKPVRSSASMVATAVGPAASITSRSLSAWRGHGVAVRAHSRQPAQRGRRHRQAGGGRSRRHPQDQAGMRSGGRRGPG